MTTELFWLTLTILMTALMWAPYVLNRILTNGLAPSLGLLGDAPLKHAPWAVRAMGAHRNAVENLVVFAPLVLIVQAANVSSLVTQWACVVYFFARAIHFGVYIIGTPVVRTLAFAVGWLAQLALIATLLHWV